ncbi:MAG: DUF1801 domain-containing protein [Woeseiaceae bacterium]
MAELKTKQNNASVTSFLAAVDDKEQRSDSKKLAKMMRAATGSRAKMWGSSIVGFGSYHYKYARGQEGDWPLVGYSPRKQNLSIYIMAGFKGSDKLLAKLGKHKTGKSCLYIKRLADVDENVLNTLIEKSVKHMRSKYETGK